MGLSSTSFKPGESGNPGGKPKGYAEIQALARTYTEEAILTLAGCMKSKNDITRVNAAEALLSRGWGKPTQPVGIDGNETKKIIQAIFHLNDEQLKS